LVAAQDVRPYDAIRDAAATRGLALIRIEAARHRVEDLFRDDPDDPDDPDEEGADGTAA
jgi:hypothetical protein